ncbi:probable antibacterial peptide polyprotein, partial [Musca vetustissima]|uniref:probable antibacterial peptide polyprotein n=1 Tax=Musca vetustissima TaxID=27455 RepID=UPI002AB758D4
KIFGLLGLATLASAAIIPYNGVRLQSDITDVSTSEPIENAETTILNDEGYKYKTVRRLKYRQRRDVSEIANEYLPPSDETVTEDDAEVKSEEEPQESAVLGADGYEYKTVRRLKYRQRRDVSEIANEYLPPSDETVTEAVAEVKSEEDPQDSAVLGADGYEYKTVRRLKYRHRRDVSEIANEYLPPSEEAVTETLAEVKSEEEPQDSAVLGADGYEYKTVRRLKYRQRRDVSEIANENLPPSEETTTEAVAEVKSEEEPQDSAVLGADGYEYKTVRRLKYRQRRDVSEIANEYLPPSEETVTEAEVKTEEEPQDSAVLGADGYEYKTVRRLKYRQRRDVSEIANEYLPPSEETTTEADAEVKSEEEPQDSAVLGADGYEYKTVRRLKYRQRRDVSEIANEYLPPSEEAVTEAVAEVKSEEEPQDSAVLGADGYEYKTVRRLKYRQRRDVSEIANEYLPPSEETTTEAVAEVKSEEEPQDSAVLGADGYEYKTVRRLKYRQRRDVSEIANEYLPPSEETTTEAVAEVKSEEEPQESAVLGADGYEYKTVRRLKYRQRRDVSEIANEYLPPSEETTTEAVAEIKSEEEPQDSAVLGADGYEYKTVRRLKYRQRRDVSEIANEYLPPSEEAVTEAVAEVKSEEEPQDSAVLGADGYEYKTVRRLKYRQRRDVSEIANEYLPPSEETTTEAVVEVKSEEEPQDSAVLGADGYEYKTVRRLKYRQRRDVSEIANEYLPPSEETTTEAVAEVKSEEEPQDSAVLGADGYEYKTVRRLKYRQRRDVSEIANEYLPPSEETTTEAVVEVKSEEEPQDSAVLGADGYEYKTVRRLKYRHRRDVSEIANEYLPPSEEAVTEAVTEVKSEEEPQDSAVLGADGYEYKTVRRLKYRQRRDVSEIANEYLPPSEEAVTEAVAEVKSEEEPQDSAVLGADGYEYKTVRRLKYRHRRDVSEIANEYLPPSEEAVTEAVAEVKSEEEPQDSAVLGADGYEYKTIRRLKYRQRRDVSEIANEYLPPSEEAVTEAVAEVKSEEEPQDSAVLGADGYEYKTVRRLKFRQRRDVSEIAKEYLPPSEEDVTEAVEGPQDSAVLGADGYEYKTVRRLKFRQ